MNSHARMLCAALLLSGAAQAADPVGDALAQTQQTNRAAAASQSRINQLDDQTRQMLERFRAASWQAQQLSVYAEQLDQLAGAQDAERESLRRQVTELDRTEREILPLMLRMLDGLEKFVALDLPFLQQERKERLDNLKRLMANPDTGTAEKYRRILEAYQIEADYGRNLGAERAEVDGKTVDLLRVGRTELYSVTLDGDAAAYWDVAAAKWQPLERKYLGAVKRAIRMARETTAAELLVLPMPAAGAVQ